MSLEEKKEEAFEELITQVIDAAEERGVSDGIVLLRFLEGEDGKGQAMAVNFDFNMFSSRLKISNEDILGTDTKSIGDKLADLIKSLVEDDEDEGFSMPKDLCFSELNYNMPKKELENLYKLFLANIYKGAYIALFKDGNVLYKHLPDQDKKVSISSELFKKPINYN